MNLESIAKEIAKALKSPDFYMGMTERSVYRSLYLKRENPELYRELKYDDLDLLYFLFEPFIKPFSDALIVRRTHGDKAFNELIDMVGKEVEKYD